MTRARVPKRLATPPAPTLQFAPKAGSRHQRSAAYFVVRAAVEAGQLTGKRGGGADGGQSKLAEQLGVSRQAVSDMVKRVRRDIEAGN